jgi:PPE-repeat protein
MIDFAALPPEVNSALMYSGPGSVPMQTAATAWDEIAAELRSAAVGYGSVISGLSSGRWSGRASEAMAAATARYLGWMNAMATAAEQTAGQARAAASAYEAAFAATVPPAMVAANRAQLASLVATNVLGQNTPAIAAAEARYGEMWAQDAAVMYGYSSSSAAATRLSSFAVVPQMTSPAGPAGRSTAPATGSVAQSTLSQLTNVVPTSLQNLASPAASGSSTSGLASILNILSGNGSGGGLTSLFNDLFSSNGLGLNDNLWNTIFSSGFYMPGNYAMGDLIAFLALSHDLSGAPAAEAAGAAAGELGAATTPPPGGAGGLTGLGGLGAGLGNGVSAGLGRATLLGPLSVPPSWTPAAPSADSALTNSLGATPLAAPPAAAGGVASVPGVPAAAVHNAAAQPKYGFRPNVLARPPEAG